jgi:hypothetical protein
MMVEWNSLDNGAQTSVSISYDLFFGWEEQPKFQACLRTTSLDVEESNRQAHVSRWMVDFYFKFIAPTIAFLGVRSPVSVYGNDLFLLQPRSKFTIYSIF